MPVSAPTSLKRPSRWFSKTKFWTVSLATMRSANPSPLKSVATTPSDLAAGTPVDGLVTCTPPSLLMSVKRPPPSLR